MSARLFELGRVEVTAAAQAALLAAGVDSTNLLLRHQSGDWGDLDRVWWESNDLAVEYQQLITSMYSLNDETCLVVSTAADRSFTCVLLENERERREVSAQEGYALWAESYDSEKNPLIAVEEPHVDELIAALPIAHALDVGAGTGRYALKLARRGAVVRAVDQSSEMLSVAQYSAQVEGLAIDFQLASLDAGLPFQSRLFDFVICALMLCHVPDLVRAAGEFHRVLRPGGFLLITDFHPGAVGMGWRTVFAQPGISYYLPNMPHTRDDYLEALRTAGFSMLNVIDVLLRDVPPGYLSDLLMREHGDKLLSLIILAQRHDT